ncbi:sensor histidine kinase [Vallitalea okinawensis]|uniref:sensor histidine kinase n=1 Tax=Vallitalea okinawensis TaxID=2078660 RepID=UPI000CFD8FE7|nr:histidine kinase [Vallitalea okinawensis]
MGLQYFHKYKLRIQLITINLLIALSAILIFSVGGFTIYYNKMEENVNNLTDIYFYEVSERLQRYFDQVEVMSEVVFYNAAMQTIALGYSGNWQEYQDYDNLIGKYMEMDTTMNDIIFMKNDGDYYYYNDYIHVYPVDTFLKRENYLKHIKDYKLHVIGPLILDNVESDDFYFIRRVKGMSIDLPNYLEEIGIGIMAMKQDEVNSILHNSNLPPATATYLIDEAGKILASTNDTQGYYYTLEEEKKGFIIKKTGIDAFDNNFTLICHLPRDYFYRDLYVYSTYIVIAMIILLIITVIGSLLLNIHVTKPIKELADAFDKVATGDLKSRLKFTYKNEITAIEQNFNNMMNEIYTLNKNIIKNQSMLYEAELDKKQFEYRSLQNQISSHFLYNTLNMIRGMAYSGQKQEMGELINKLVAYLRYIARESQYVSIKEELEHLKNYTYIQQKRFNNKIKVIVDVGTEVKEEKLLKLLMQPLIENAAKHGLNQWCGRGIIKITIKKIEKDLLIKVMDNGCGMTLERLKLINTFFKAEKNQEEHIGLHNIQRRIQLEYGQQYGIEVRSWEGRGTVMIMKLPLLSGDRI